MNVSHDQLQDQFDHTDWATQRGPLTFAIYNRADTSKPAHTIKTPWYNMDKIHRSGNRQIASGMMFDEQACGGTRKKI